MCHIAKQIWKLNDVRGVIFWNVRPDFVLWFILLVSVLSTTPKKSLTPSGSMCKEISAMINIIWSVVCNLKWSGSAIKVVLSAVQLMTRRSLCCELFLSPFETMVLLTDDSALLLWCMPTHAGHYVRCHGTMLLPVSDVWRFVIKSS